MGWTVEDMPSQEGRIAVVTGANIGLGLETTRALAQKGATVVMACRSRSRGEEARRQLLDEGLTGLDLLEMDLADLRSVERAIDVLKNQYGHLDLLLNNAGVMAVPDTRTPDGFEIQMQTNLDVADKIGRAHV